MRGAWALRVPGASVACEAKGSTTSMSGRFRRRARASRERRGGARGGDAHDGAGMPRRGAGERAGAATSSAEAERPAQERSRRDRRAPCPTASTVANASKPSLRAAIAPSARVEAERIATSTVRASRVTDRPEVEPRVERPALAERRAPRREAVERGRSALAVERYVDSLPVARAREAATGSGRSTSVPWTVARMLWLDEPRNAFVVACVKTTSVAPASTRQVDVDRVAVDEAAAERDEAHGRGARAGERRQHQAERARRVDARRPWILPPTAGRDELPGAGADRAGAFLRRGSCQPPRPSRPDACHDAAPDGELFSSRRAFPRPRRELT